MTNIYLDCIPYWGVHTICHHCFVIQYDESKREVAVWTDLPARRHAWRPFHRSLREWSRTARVQQVEAGPCSTSHPGPLTRGSSSECPTEKEGVNKEKEGESEEDIERGWEKEQFGVKLPQENWFQFIKPGKEKQQKKNRFNKPFIGISVNIEKHEHVHHQLYFLWPLLLQLWLYCNMTLTQWLLF